MEELFHVSDQTGITRFEPRPPPPGNTTHTGRMVWAVGQRLLHNYLVPCIGACCYCAESHPQVLVIAKQIQKAPDAPSASGAFLHSGLGKVDLVLFDAAHLDLNVLAVGYSL